MQLKDDHFFLTASQDILQICQPLSKLNINHFSYTRSQPDGKRIYLTTHPELLKNYFINEFYRVGNCEFNPSAYKEQILLWSTLPKQYIYEEAKQFGIYNGIFMIVPGSNSVEFFNFATTNKELNIVNIYLSYLEILKNFIYYFKYEAESIIRKAEKNNFILPYSKDPFVFMDEITKSSMTINHIFINKKINLSNKQHACAVKLIRGKSIKSIAKELNLSPRTVETYVNNLKNKFGLTTKTELCIRLATMLMD